eukprot:TRINITY_DN930_c1_g1_i2.p1 TRINITY_DN930_c1_g1~~TRINITY_DN930_c1_g1_i2.p1  ORF type:complete len:365 (+),score=47.30 TRINITY_DN930_c1_g1_i2:51-1097(+)
MRNRTHSSMSHSRRDSSSSSTSSFTEPSDADLAASVMANMQLFQEAELVARETRTPSYGDTNDYTISSNNDSSDSSPHNGRTSRTRSRAKMRRRSSAAKPVHGHIIMESLDNEEPSNDKLLAVQEQGGKQNDVKHPQRRTSHSTLETVSEEMQKPRHMSRSSTSTSDLSRDSMNLISLVRSQLIMKAIKHRFEFLLFGIGVSLILLPLIFLFRITLVQYFEDFFAAGFSQDQLSTLATTSTGADRMVVLGIDMIAYVTVFLVISFPLYYLVMFSVMFEERFEWKTIPQRFPKTFGVLLLALITQAVPVLVQVVGGSITILTPLSGGVRVLLTGVCGLMTAKVIASADG